MPPALDRLLASPSALRLLRSLVRAPEFTSNATRRCCCKAPRRAYSSGQDPTPRVKWPHWSDNSQRKLYHPSHGSNEGAEEQDQVVQWAQELMLQERLHRLNGIRDVWDANNTLSLPTEDTPDAEFLWGTFLKHSDLVLPVISHAAYMQRKTGAVYPHLYELCMGHWLVKEKYVEDALEYHRVIKRKLKPQKLPLRQLARRLAMQHCPPRAYEVFMHIYIHSNEKDVYDEVIPAFLARGRVALAMEWHALCLSRGDLPSPKVASNPWIQKLPGSPTDLSPAEAEVVAAVARAKSAKSEMNHQLLRRLQGRDIAPVRFDDATCARMFATRAFPPDTVIKGIAMIGVNEIGPLAVRTMAARAEQAELPRLFEELKTAGIALQGCVFSLALEKFAMEKNWSLVRSMLDSDQHPDVYGDRKLQRRLLDFYLQEQDWAQAHRTLAILSLFHNDSSTAAWNILLQARIKDFDPLDPLHVLQTLETMGVHGVLLNSESIAAIMALLRPRQRGHKPGRSTRGGFDDLRFVMRAYTYILERGIGRIHPCSWWEVIRRFGMLGRLRELRRLLFWLLCWYAPRNGTKFDRLPKPASLDAATEKLRAAYPYPQAYSTSYFFFSPYISRVGSIHHPVRQLFPPSLQQGIVVWGFRAGLLPNASLEQSMLPPALAKLHYRARLLRKGILQRLEWSSGLRMLVKLRDMGVDVHRHTVTKALQMMLITLFGRGRSNKKENRVMAINNTIPYVVYVREINRIWGTPLFREPQLYGKSRMHGLMWHPRFARTWGHHRRIFLRIAEVIPEWEGQDELEERKLPRTYPWDLLSGAASTQQKVPERGGVAENENGQPHKQEEETVAEELLRLFNVQSEAMSAKVHPVSAPNRPKCAPAAKSAGRRRPFGRGRTRATSKELMASEPSTLRQSSGMDELVRASDREARR
ncbi:hypothetical protein K458DRAFT_423909 [Lentithecium fluviatile CBS 122367]|uniref:Pentatricopeptide repeat domain-containing protein n=1 Tax=Lentithecium fluviatile CBS 122367 TaxID=1168545 RepID=A0A6G1IGS7_9PLEO|nr:hypothetical protein K458DRAFT_423909 [Lentithecium fluviatile CBS 122367]